MIRIAFFFLFAARCLAGSDPAPADGKVGHRVLILTLPKAVQFALAKNFSIAAERYTPRISRENVRTALGRFDPSLDVTYLHSEDDVRDLFTTDPATNAPRHFGVSQNSESDTLGIGVSGVTVWGLGYDVGATARRFKNASSLLGAEYSNELTFSVTQPLLRGAGRDVNLSSVRIARNNVAISEWTVKERLISVITNVITTYNELYFARENLEVARQSQALARQLLQDNIKRVQAGMMKPLDVTTAQAEVAAREDAVLTALRAKKDQENFLKQLITDDLIPLLGTSVAIEPPKPPEFFATVIAGVKEALELRPDYRQAKLDIENRKITVAVQKNALLPRLDLNASLNLLGLDNDFGTALSRTNNRDQGGWSAGATFSIPIGNRDARGRYNAATLEAAQALVRLQDLEQTIIVQVDNANGAVMTAKHRVEANVEASRLAKESLDAGEKRLIAGTGTVFEVLQLQRDLAAARTNELRAQADYYEAIAQYQQQTGTTLRIHHVTLD